VKLALLQGKSTVTSLLERFYDVDSGHITVDGYDIRSLDPTWLRGRVIGFINQVRSPLHIVFVVIDFVISMISK